MTMTPRHPVPEGYGSPCVEGEFVPQGTGSGPVVYKYEEWDTSEGAEYNRGARDIDSFAQDC